MGEHTYWWSSAECSALKSLPEKTLIRLCVCVHIHMYVYNQIILYNNNQQLSYQPETVWQWKEFEERAASKGKGESDAILVQLKTYFKEWFSEMSLNCSWRYLILCFLRLSLILYPRLAWKSLYSGDWYSTHDSVSWVLESQAWASMLAHDARASLDGFCVLWDDHWQKDVLNVSTTAP